MAAPIKLTKTIVDNMSYYLHNKSFNAMANLRDLALLWGQIQKHALLEQRLENALWQDNAQI